MFNSNKTSKISFGKKFLAASTLSLLTLVPLASSASAATMPERLRDPNPSIGRELGELMADAPYLEVNEHDFPREVSADETDVGEVMARWVQQNSYPGYDFDAYGETANEGNQDLTDSQIVFIFLIAVAVLGIFAYALVTSKPTSIGIGDWLKFTEILESLDYLNDDEEMKAEKDDLVKFLINLIDNNKTDKEDLTDFQKLILQEVVDQLKLDGDEGRYLRWREVYLMLTDPRSYYAYPDTFVM